jgi:hypothetical protein
MVVASQPSKRCIGELVTVRRGWREAVGILKRVTGISGERHYLAVLSAGVPFCEIALAIDMRRTVLLLGDCEQLGCTRHLSPRLLTP